MCSCSVKTISQQLEWGSRQISRQIFIKARWEAGLEEDNCIVYDKPAELCLLKIMHYRIYLALYGFNPLECQVTRGKGLGELQADIS
jgi:hypothetical protein